MLENIKEEVNSFIKDIDKIVKDPDERNSMIQRSIVITKQTKMAAGEIHW